MTTTFQILDMFICSDYSTFLKHVLLHLIFNLKSNRRSSTTDDRNLARIWFTLCFVCKDCGKSRVHRNIL